jgi:hypothetical protein
VQKKDGRGAEKLADVAQKFGISATVLAQANTGFISDASTPLAVGIPLRVPCILPKKAQGAPNRPLVVLLRGRHQNCSIVA